MDIISEVLRIEGMRLAKRIDRQLITELTKYKPKRIRHRAIAKAKKRKHVNNL